MFPSMPLVVSWVLSVTFTSYLSKLLGKFTVGAFSSLRFPAPLTTMRRLSGSPVFTSFLFSCAEMVKLPTPPEKLAGRVGNGSTCKVSPGASISFFTSTYPAPPLKMASKGSTFRFLCTTIPSNLMLGIFSSPLIWGYITYWLHVTHL